MIRGQTVERPVNGNGSVKKPRPENRISSGDKHLEWIPVGRMRISERAQRSHDSASSRAKIEDIAGNFDPDKFGTLTVNLRDNIYWIIDGGHRYLGVIQWFGEGWEKQHLQCWTYEGLSEAEESDKFLALNDVKQVSGMDKFRQSVNANRPTECDIDRVVRAAGMKVGTGRDYVSCVGAIQKVYASGGPTTLATTLRIIRDSYGMPGFASKVTEGVGMFVARYNDRFNEALLVQRLSSKRGGVVGLVGEAQGLKIKHGVSLAEAIAATAVETYNRGRGGQRLAGWWSSFPGVG